MHKEIENFSNYLIFDDGRCYSTISNKFLKPILRSKKKPYLYYKLFDSNGKPHPKYVHILVAKEFIPNPNNLPLVNHKDENKQNNCVDNLEWCDNEYNINYSVSKPIYQYTTTGELVAVYASLKYCQENGFNSSCVSMSCNNKYLGGNIYKGFIWKYA